jgi:hypothetical protein
MLKNKLMLLTILFRPISIAAWQTIAPRARRAGLLIALIALGICLAWLPLPLAATGLLGALAIVIILLRPVWGLVGLILLIPFSPLVSLRIGGVQVGGMEALLGLILVAWLLRMATRREIVIPHPPLLLPWLLWLGVILASWTVALSLGDALAETLKWLEMLALYLFIAANVERRHLPWLVGVMLLAGMAQAALGLYQFLFRVGPESFLLFGGRFLRAYGTFRQPNPYAGYLGLVLPVAYSLVLGGLGAGGWKLEGSGRRLAVGGLPAPSPQPPALTHYASRFTFSPKGTYGHALRLTFLRPDAGRPVRQPVTGSVDWLRGGRSRRQLGAGGTDGAAVRTGDCSGSCTGRHRHFSNPATVHPSTFR